MLMMALADVAQDGTSVQQWADSARAGIEAGFAAGRADQVAAARRVAERGLELFPKDPLLKHYEGYGYFREGLLREGDAARTTLERSREVLNDALTLQELPESRAVLSAVHGNLIGGSVFRAIRHGRASTAEMDRALSAGPQNPRVWLLKGAGALFAPSMFGGGADQAEVALRKAIVLFATDKPAPGMPTWGLAEAHGYLALALAKQQKGTEARAVLAEGLRLAPGHAFLLTRVQPDVARSP